MGLSVVEADESAVVIEAPPEPNRNHLATAFGGSVSALAILAGWTAVHVRLRAEGLGARVVIQESSVHYDKPIHGTFRAVTGRLDERGWSRLKRALLRRGRGRVWVEVVVSSESGDAASFRGAYVALALDP